MLYAITSIILFLLPEFVPMTNAQEILVLSIGGILLLPFLYEVHNEMIK